jgi:hypothetical protein
VNYREAPVPAFLFDLDGMLIDSVYQNVIAWPGGMRWPRRTSTCRCGGSTGASG